ncbi:PepSY domain-containing protein [Emticicia sp. CRIBPO]|uniref:PepSY-associated TM helix domain-containing protein n=1 Tax=Emticicia sp. CRIBPO TaxID=2683258 RepID=UPI0014123401|nr:PepSY-associated TM helix domain-containing protein [Emticicia sp. CRIBPO]NBA86545.1 PepSY domain-containing protein [Emticicia sp. CRIBPO]
MKRVVIYRRLFSIHKWLGLVTGFFLLLIGLSGSVLVFKEELESAIYSDYTKVNPKGKMMSLDSIYKMITDKYPHLDGLAWVNPAAPPTHSYQFRLYLNDERLSSYDLGTINIDQYTGKIIRSGRSDDLEVGWIEWIYQFHFSLHLGTPGAALTAVFGLAMLTSILTGIMVYRKFIWKVLLFKVRIRTHNWRIFSSQLHRVVGVWSLLFNILIFFTGFWMNLFAFEPESWKKETLPTPQNTLLKISPEHMYHEALSKLPGLVPAYVYLPTQPDKKFSVRGRFKDQNSLFAEGNSITMDPQTGEVSAVTRFEDLPFWDKAEALVFPLHIGNYGGVPVRILYVIIGLTPGLLGITGFLMWRRRKTR